MDRQRYRELTPIEMEIVAGGTASEDPIEVWGNPYDVDNGGWNSE